MNDIVQECYCRIANLRDISHIEQPRAYFFSIIRNLLQERLRAARVVRIEAFADLDFEPESDSPSPERVIAARLELGRVHEALGQLTERARRIFILRKIEGMSQREIARVLDVTEAVVENDASRGLRLVLKALTQPDARLPSASAIREGNHVRSR